MTELLCIGNAIVDVFASANSVWLDEMGITEPVQHISPDLARRIFEKINSGNGITKSSGGAAANVAKIAAMLNIEAVFTGCTGPDELAAVFDNELRCAGVVPLLARGSEKTGICFVFNCGSETRIAASPGASLEFNEKNVPDTLVTAAKILVLDGFMLDRRPLVRHILQLAHRHEIPIALDAASAFQIREKTWDILQYSRLYPLIIFMNVEESIVFYNTIKGNNPQGSTNNNNEHENETLILREICPALKCITAGKIFPIIVIKLGGRGAVVLAGGNIYHEETITIIPRNTVGAGDAFCAAFLSAWIRGKSIQECAALGNKVAGEILMVPGTGIKKNKLQSFAKLLRK
jgi:sugar/nucleoside kinase (ribokinase family)